METELNEKNPIEVAIRPEVKTLAPTVAVVSNFPSLDYIDEYEAFLNNYDKFVNRMLKEDVDFGTIPGVEKPTLLKPGAEKLEKLFTLRHKKECVEKEIGDKYSFVKYTYRTSIYNKQGQLVATCEGSCNSHEKKYRSHWVFANQATDEEMNQGRKEIRKSKKGGDYEVYVVDKKDFYDLENTIMKMAQKRSYVGAILEATNSSSRFTQDVEDMDIQVKEEVPKVPTGGVNAQTGEPFTGKSLTGL